MAAGKSSRINRQYKTKYRIRNWREYERGLRSRGDVTIWLSEDAIAAWIPPKNGLRGGQRRYSNLAIRTALTLRVVFGLPLRQTEGFLDSLLSLMSRDLKAPDHTTLSRRNVNWASASPCSARRRISVTGSRSCPSAQAAISVNASMERASVVSMFVGRRSIPNSDLRH